MTRTKSWLVLSQIEHGVLGIVTQLLTKLAKNLGFYPSPDFGKL